MEHSVSALVQRTISKRTTMGGNIHWDKVSGSDGTRWDVCSLRGSMQATWYDCKILHQSHLEAMLDLTMGHHHGFCLYGDATDRSHFPWVVASLKHLQITSLEL